MKKISKNFQRKISLILLVILLQINLTNLLEAQVKTQKTLSPIEKVDDLLSKYDTKNAPGVAVSVVQNGKIIYKKGFGIANLEYNIPIMPNSVFSVASISKQFTVFCILLLEKEGKLSLDDDIRKFLPEITDFGQKITLRNLANHTSGLREQTDLNMLAGARMDDVITNEQAYKIIKKQKESNFIAGTEYEYSNSDYLLLGKIVEKISGKTLAEFASERIFTPLKMNNTFFLDNHEKIIPNRVYSYTPVDEKTYKKNMLNHSIIGSTGLCTTIEDLSFWALNFENIIIGDTNIFNKMQQKSSLNNGEKISYALGQEIKTYKGLEVIFHGGGDAGFRSYLLRVPKHQFSIIIMANFEGFNPLEIAYKIVDFFLENQQIKENKQNNTKKIVIKEERLKSYEGNFEILPGIIFNIHRDTKNSQKLYLQTLGDTQKSELFAISENEFVIGDGNDKISFHKTGEISKQKIDLLKFQYYDFEYKGKRILIVPFDKEKAQSEHLLSAFAGKYYSSELATEYVFTIKNGVLVATHIRNEDIKMNIFQPNIFLTNEWFFRKVEFLRDKNSNIIGCKISGVRATIKFKKIE